MVDAGRARLATKLQRELVALQELEAAAREHGDERTAVDLRERIATIEAQIAMLSDRVDAIGAQSYRFDIERNADGFMMQILARPIDS